MNSMDFIKSGLKTLFQTNPNIHISVSGTRTKAVLEKKSAKIVGVYKNIFQIETCENGARPIRHTFKYGDVLIGQVVIEELNFTQPVSILNKK